jgi:imidazolonepropionase-like amidohydrolase
MYLRLTRNLQRVASSISGYALLVAGLSACQPAAPGIAEAPYTPDNGNLFVRCGALIDGIADEILHDQMVVIRDGRITAIVEGNAEIRLGMTFLDLSSSTCLPGLINMHVHLVEAPEDSVDYGIYYDRTAEDHRNVVLGYAVDNLLTGFTTIRNVGDFFPAAVYYGQEQIDSGQAIGPRIRNGGPFLTIPGGGGSLAVPYRDESEIPAASRLGEASGPDEFREQAEAAVARGADFLKVIASGAVFSFGISPGAPEMTQEEIAAVVDVARQAGIKVTAHVHSAESGKDAILAGVDSLEHASLLTDDVIALAVEHGVAFSMDVYNGTYTDTVGREQNYPEQYLQRNFDTTEAQRVVFEKAYAAGVPIMYGTDAGVLPHDMGGWQFAIMVERGMTPMDAIKSATSVPADHMGIQADVGAIEKGRFGDLIAVHGNPLVDMTIMRSVDVVIKGGLVFKLQEHDE